jgi:hypothetical protein
MKKRLRSIIYLILTLSFGLTACGVRPYDYLVLPWETLSANLWGTPTAEAAAPRMLPTFTSLPPASTTPTASASPTNTFAPDTVTPTALSTPQPGMAQVMLENRLPFTLYIRLQSNVEWGFELAAKEARQVQFPAGVYDYWLIVSGQESLHGQRVFPPGFSSFILYDTPAIVESPTPQLPGLEISTPGSQ